MFTFSLKHWQLWLWCCLSLYKASPIYNQNRLLCDSSMCKRAPKYWAFLHMLPSVYVYTVLFSWYCRSLPHHWWFCLYTGINALKIIPHCKLMEFVFKSHCIATFQFQQVHKSIVWSEIRVWMLNKGSTSWKQKMFGILLQKKYQLCYSMVGKYRTLGTFFMSIEARS